MKSIYFYVQLYGHDVGNLRGRNQHNRKVIDVASRLKNSFFVDADVKKYIMQIATAHTGSDGVRKEIPLEDVDYKNEEINLRFLGAVLRFTDELDEGDMRVDPQYYEPMKDLIEDEKKIYWEAPLCIKRITPNLMKVGLIFHAILIKKIV